MARRNFVAGITLTAATAASTLLACAGSAWGMLDAFSRAVLSADESISLSYYVRLGDHILLLDASENNSLIRRPPCKNAPKNCDSIPVPTPPGLVNPITNAECKSNAMKTYQYNMSIAEYDYWKCVCLTNNGSPVCPEPDTPNGPGPCTSRYNKDMEDALDKRKAAMAECDNKFPVTNPIKKILYIPSNTTDHFGEFTNQLDIIVWSQAEPLEIYIGDAAPGLGRCLVSWTLDSQPLITFANRDEPTPYIQVDAINGMVSSGLVIGFGTITSKFDHTISATIYRLNNAGEVVEVIESNPIRVIVPLPCSAADIVDQSGQPGGDGQLTPSDVVAFFVAYLNSVGCPGATPCNPADITDGSGTGPADGMLSSSDVVAFFGAFFTGCGS